MLNIAVEHEQIKGCACSTVGVRNESPHVLSMLNARDPLDPSITPREVNHAQILAIYALSSALAPERVVRSCGWNMQSHPQSSWTRSPT